MLDKIVSKSTKPKTLAIKPSAAKPLQQTVQVLPVSMNSGTGVPHPVIVTDQQPGPVYVISSTNQNTDLVFSEQNTVQIPVTVENTEQVADLSPVVVNESVPKESIPTSTPIGSNRRKAIAPKVRISSKFTSHLNC